MRRVVVLGLAVAAATAVAIGGGAPAQPPAAAPVLGIIGTPANHEVARLDPLTLRPQPGPRAALGEFHDGWAFSPDGSRAAFGISASGRRGRTAVRVIDRGSLETVAELEASAAARVVGWVGRERLAGLTIPSLVIAGGRRRDIPGELVLWDVRSGKILASRPSGFPDRCAPASASTPRGFAAVVTGGRAPRLALLGADGGYRTAALGRTPAAPRDGACGALVVDGGRAFVVAAGAPTAEVDLDTLAVRYRAAGAPPVRRSCAARAGCVPSRAAVRAGPRRIAVAGEDRVLGRQTGTGAGARLLDLGAGTSRTLDARARGVVRAGSTLITYGGRGVRAFRLDGTPRYRRLAGRRVRRVQVAGGRAYAQLPGRSLVVLDPATGRTLRRSRAAPREVELLGAP